MNEHASSNITQILTSFETFLNIYQDPLWVKNVTSESVKFVFKLGLFIEKCIQKFKGKEYLLEFMKILNMWCQKKNLTTFDPPFFEFANNQILLKVFKFNDVNDSTLDICVRVFCSIYTKDRFKIFLDKLIITSSSVASIVDFVNLSVSDDSDVKNVIILNKWSDFIYLGKENILKSEIESYISLYKVEEKLPFLLNMLAVKKSFKQLGSVQNVILECILNKMCDRSVLSKNFWLTLFKKIEKTDIGKVSCIYKSFVESLWSFIEYTGSMFQKDIIISFEWKSDPVISIYPEIDYYDLFYVLKAVSNASPANRQYISKKLDQAKENSNKDLWTQIENELSFS